MRGTLARRAAQKLTVALFFLEAECALGQAQASPSASPAQNWRASASYGQASAPRSQGFAEFASLGLAREFDLGSRFSLSIEFTPLFVVNETRVDLPGRPREAAWAAAVSPVFAWTYAPERSRFGLRLEGGVGIIWGFSPIPAEGSRFNFLDQLAGIVTVRAGTGRFASFGVRRLHVSNLGLAGKDNPGLSFYAGVAGVSWSAR